MIAITICPACKHDSFQPYLQCKDYTVSNQTFDLVQCECCGLVITSPQPTKEALNTYYYLSDDYISHTNKAKSFIDKLYLIARHFTLKWKLSLVNQYSQGKTILDFGCGTGEFLHTCYSNQWNIAGIEPSDKARSNAMALTGTQNIHKSIEEIDNKQFSAITLWHVLEHVSDIHETLAELKLRLTNNGTMFIAVPNHRSLDALKYQQYWAGYDVPRHLWHFSKSSMAPILNKHKLAIRTILPMKLDAYYISLISEKYKRQKTGINAIASALTSAMRSNNNAKKTGEYSSLIYVVKNES